MLKFVFIFLVIIWILSHCFNYLDYWEMILNNRIEPDYVRWILSDKYIAKEYAKTIGFKTPESYQLVSDVGEINFNKLPINYVIKPVDLCDSEGVYLMKDNLNLIDGQTIPRDQQSRKICQSLKKLRYQVDSSYYMYDLMYHGMTPYTGYIVEELLLDADGNLPSDYKCYVFGGKVYFIVCTYDRQIIDGRQTYKSVWMTPDWKPFWIPMTQKDYYFTRLPKPKCLDKLIQLVEKAGRKFERHCRIDTYIVNNEVYLGEFTFFCGAQKHSKLGNMILGSIWLMNPDNYSKKIPELEDIVPDFYNNPIL